MDALAATLWNESVVRSAYANGPRLVSELDEAADDETLSKMFNKRIEDESNGRDADPTDRPA